MFCPKWLFEACCGSATDEYLRLDLPIEIVSKKYAHDVLSEDYDAIEAAEILGSLESMVKFLSEIEAGEAAADQARGFCYYRAAFDGPGRERKIKTMFGSQLDGVKTKDYSQAATTKGVQSLCFCCPQQAAASSSLIHGAPSQLTDIGVFQKLSHTQSTNVLDFPVKTRLSSLVVFSPACHHVVQESLSFFKAGHSLIHRCELLLI